MFENNIYFYGDVCWQAAIKLNMIIHKMNASSTARKTNSINLFIHSEGGDLFAGLSSMDHISNSEIPITTIVDGFAASAGAVMVLGGATRKMMPHSFMLIHQLSTGFWGKYEDLKDEVKNCNLFMQDAVKIYRKKTSIPEKKLKTFMKRDVYLNLEKCMKYNIVDELFTGH
jgi:ATP-dependent Clp endopeptidase proteolytic subunit ClpP